MPVVAARLTSADTGQGFEFLSFSGELQPMLQRVREVTRPGVDGHAYAKAGRRAAATRHEVARDFLDADDAALTIAALRDLTPGLFAVRILRGGTHLEFAGVMLLDVEVVSIAACAAAANGFNLAPKCVAVLSLTLQQTAVP